MSVMHKGSFIQVVLCGRLGQNAKLVECKSGAKMLTFSVGTSVSVKEASGSYTTATTWHDCIMFGSRAEKIAAYLVKGTVLSIQGTISYREVELKNGYKGKTASILVDDVQLLSSPAKTATASPTEQPRRAPQAQSVPPFDVQGEAAPF